MPTLQKSKPAWFSRRPDPVPPPPPINNPIEAALGDYQTLRDNYANACGQLTEQYDLMRELAHQNEALENTIKEDRAYYQGEIDLLRNERDQLIAFRVGIRTRMSTIVQVILAADREANESAVAISDRSEPELPLEPVRQVRPYTADSVQDIADELAKITGGGDHADYAPPSHRSEVPTNSL
jgi:hypothetical protein